MIAMVMPQAVWVVLVILTALIAVWVMWTDWVEAHPRPFRRWATCPDCHKTYNLKLTRWLHEFQPEVRDE